ncbi:hypothetical protein [Egbenema bharatensis]|uniref:hypothetical protein n=1 Tax=Egbenema bharatensis TaxID=3463334 RepID=UPI003A89C7C6
MTNSTLEQNIIKNLPADRQEIVEKATRVYTYEEIDQWKKDTFDAIMMDVVRGGLLSIASESKNKLRGECWEHQSNSGSSFYVDFEKGYCKCDGCDDKWANNPAQFLVKRYDLSWDDAVWQINEMSGLVLLKGEYVSEEAKGKRHFLSQRSIVLETIMTLAANEMAVNEEVQNYVKDRGFSDDAVVDLLIEEKIGYIPNNSDKFLKNLIDALIENKDLIPVSVSGEDRKNQAVNLLKENKILNSTGDKLWKNLLGRLVFPWVGCKKDELISLYAREYDNKTPGQKYVSLRNPEFNGERIPAKPTPLGWENVNFDEPIITVEGVFDVLLGQSKGLNCLAWVAFPNNAQI